MEVGAVKQAFNNEIILLKKNLNQAKIQTIHKLTRKAKTLTEKKSPESLKEKLKRKAESAVKEVLIIKKIKTRDIARFIVTHSGKLNDYLNKPIVDSNKACARLLLHKALQHKYKHIRENFSDISIKDLFMSRQERRKLKKEAREKQKNKKKGKKDKSDAIHVEGEWNVEINEGNSAIVGDETVTKDLKSDESLKSGEDTGDSEEEIDKSDVDVGDESEIGEESDTEESSDRDRSSTEDVTIGIKRKPLVLKENDSDSGSSNEESIEQVQKVNLHKKTYKERNLNAKENKKNKTESIEKNRNKKDLLNRVDKLKAIEKEDSVVINKIKKKQDKKVNKSKNKNLKNKLENRNFHKEMDELPNEATKMVDPFFITSTGDNYMSLVEPRQPDEVKELHKQGNRQYRRAVMFGHVPRTKPKRHFESRNNDNSYRNDNYSEMDKNNYNDRHNRSFRKNEGFTKIPDRNNLQENSVPEKLHPSWEAKKKQSTILPFQGKKIVFDEH